MSKTRELGNFFQNAPNSIGEKTKNSSQSFKNRLYSKNTNEIPEQKEDIKENITESKVNQSSKTAMLGSFIKKAPSNITENSSNKWDNFKTKLSRNDSEIKKDDDMLNSSREKVRFDKDQIQENENIDNQNNEPQEETRLIKESSSTSSYRIQKQKTRKQDIEKQITMEMQGYKDFEQSDNQNTNIVENESENKKKKSEFQKYNPNVDKHEKDSKSTTERNQRDYREKMKILNESSVLSKTKTVQGQTSNYGTTKANTTYSKSRNKRLSPLLKSKYEIEQKVKFDRLKEMERQRNVLVQKLMGIDEEIDLLHKQIEPPENFEVQKPPKYNERIKEIATDKNAHRNAVSLVRKLNQEKKEREKKKIEKINMMRDKLKSKTDHSVKAMEERKKQEQLQKKMKVYNWYEKRKKEIEESKENEAKSKAFVMNIYQSTFHNKSRIESSKKVDLEEVLKEKMEEYEILREKERELEDLEKSVLPKI